jgi:hypothetical protein
MKCIHCGVEYSHSVLLVHQEWCGEQNAEPEEEIDKPLEKMTVAELLEVVTHNNIDLGDAKLKPEILAAILKWGEANGGSAQ